jgi:hypothetical protein
MICTKINEKAEIPTIAATHEIIDAFGEVVLSEFPSLRRSRSKETKIRVAGPA